ELFSGQTRTVTFTGSGNAQLTVSAKEHRSALTATVEASASCFFGVVDQPETITINPTMSGSGVGQSTGSVWLTGKSQLGVYIFDFASGVVVNDTLPRSITLQPGNYTITVRASTLAITNTLATQVAGPNANFNVTLTLTMPSTEYHWKNPAGGSFNTASNWDPQRAPDSGAVTVFDLEGNFPSSVPVQAANNAVGQLFIRRMPVHFTGPLRVMGASADHFGFTVEDGGALVLDSGAIFKTQDASIGSGSGESIVLVSGTGTKWTSSS